MVGDTGAPTATAAAAGPRKKRSRGWRIFRVVLIGIAVSAALLLAFPPLGLIKDQIARSAGDATGRTVTIGEMDYRVNPFLTLEFRDVRVSNPPGMAERDLFHADTARATVEFFPLLKGRIRLESLVLINPLLSLEEGSDGTRNWVFTSQLATPGAAPEGTTPQAAQAAEFRPPSVTLIENGGLTYASAVTGSQHAASRINGSVLLDLATGGATAKGNLDAGSETVTFDIALGDYDAPLTGGSSSLKGSLDARLLRATLDGDAAFASDAEFRGALAASTPSLLDFVRWLGADAAPGGEPLKTSLEGHVVATTGDIAFTDTDVMINTTASRFNGTVGFAGERPKIAGDIASEHLDIDRILGTTRRTSFMPLEPETTFEPLVAPGWEQLLADLKALEAGPQARADAAPSAAAPTWSEQPFNLKAIRAVDLDATISAAQVSYGQLDLRQGKVKADIADGVLDAKIEELAIGAGRAVGTLSLDTRAEPPKGAVDLTLSNVAAEPIVVELTGNPLLSGTSNVEISATAAGQNQSQLTATLDGKARFQMGQGALRGFNVRRMIFEWWKSWKFDLAQRTSFERLDAQYDIRRGILQSRPGLSMGGSEVEINSTGSVNVPARSLNQEIRVKAIPPPTALPIPVRISGSWTSPSIGIDWWGLFSAAPDLGGPQALQPAPEPPPAEVEIAIRRVLALNLPSDQLSPQARDMLRSLLPREDNPNEDSP